MGKGFKKGRGSRNPLNFKVVDGTTAPENTTGTVIWVNTDTKMTGWELNAAEPSNPYEGMIWIKTGSNGHSEFNAIKQTASKKNAIMLQPYQAAQYVSGAWVVKTAQTFQNGEAKDWAFYMFKEGSGFAEGFTGFNADWVNGEITYTDSLITIPLYKKAGYSGEYFASNEAVDLTNYRTAYLSGLTASHSGASGYSTSIWYGFGPEEDEFAVSQYLDTSSGPNGTYINDGVLAIDVSTLTGKHFLMGKFSCSDEDETHFTTKIKNIYFV